MLGNKEVMANNITKCMEMHNKSRQEMCTALGVKYTTFSDWVNAKTYPRIDKIELMANYFGISKASLVELEHFHKKSKGVEIPVLGRVAASVPYHMMEEVLDYEKIDPKLASTGEFFALRIKGESMMPRICDGDVVIIKVQSDAESGDTVIATINGDDATCKRLKKYNDSIMLIANNPNYEPIVYDQKDIVEKPVTIIGKVVELRGKF